MEMKIKAIAPWFGGKRTMAPKIVSELGEHVQYFEPFCGSMAVLFAKEPSQKETVNDLHGDLVNLARVVQEYEAAQILYDRLQRTLFSEGLLDQAQQELSHELLDISGLPSGGPALNQHIERAYWYFLTSWMGRNGTAGTERVDYQICVRWTKGGGSPTVRWRNTIKSLPAWHQRLQNVVITRRDAFAFIHKFEDVPQTAIYIDPPYFHQTRGSNDNRPGGAGRYLHEFREGSSRSLFQEDNNTDQHAELAQILRRYRKARIVVSYYDCLRARDLYDGWTFVDKTRHKHLHVQNTRGAKKKEAPEVLIINGPSYG